MPAHDLPSPPASPGERRGQWLVTALLVAIGLLHLAGVALADEPQGPLPPWLVPFPLGEGPLAGLMAIFAAFGALGFVAIVLGSRAGTARPLARRAGAGLLAACVALGGVAYFSNQPLRQDRWVHSWDTAIYGIGSKYFYEVDYFALNECIVAVLGPKRIPPETRVRELTTYKIVAAATVLRAAPSCRKRFSEKRWQDFKDDVLSYNRTGMGGISLLRRVVADKGYNGTPLHTAVSSALMNLWPVNYDTLRVLTSIDVVAIVAMLVTVTWCMGWRVGLLFALSFFTLPVDRFAVNGGSLFRHLWMASLTIGMVTLHARRYGAAAVALVFSALLQAFPLAFLLGVGPSILVQRRRDGHLSPEHRRFLAAAAMALVVLGGASVAHGHGLRNYSLFQQDMAVHSTNGPDEKLGTLEPFQGFGVGMKWALTYPGHEVLANGIADQAALTVHYRRIKWPLRIVAMLLTALALLVATRLKPVEGAALVGFTAFFCLLGAAGYYFACASLLLLGFATRLLSQDSPVEASSHGGDDADAPASRTAGVATATNALERGDWVLPLLLGFLTISVVGDAFMGLGGNRYIVYHSIVSPGWLLWLLAYLGVLARESWQHDWRKLWSTSAVGSASPPPP